MKSTHKCGSTSPCRPEKVQPTSLHTCAHTHLHTYSCAPQPHAQGPVYLHNYIHERLTHVHEKLEENQITQVCTHKHTPTNRHTPVQYSTCRVEYELCERTSGRFAPLLKAVLMNLCCVSQQEQFQHTDMDYIQRCDTEHTHTHIHHL